MTTAAWLNGRIIDEFEPALSIRERGFLYGDGLFETVRIYCGQPFLWERHLARLAQSCNRLGLPFSREEINCGVRAVLGKLGEVEGSLRVTLTRGVAPGRLVSPPSARPTVLVVAKNGVPYREEAYRRGFRGVIISFQRNQHSPLIGLKTLNCLEQILGRQEAAAAGADEGLFLNLNGEVVEGSVSNIFMVKGRRLVTPPVSAGLLPGIARETVLALASGLGLVVAEERIFPGELALADEAFLTNSLLEVMPLVMVDGHKIGSGLPGEVTGELRRAYRKLVEAKTISTPCHL